MSSINLHDVYHESTMYFSRNFQKKWLETIDKTEKTCYNRTIRTAQPIPERRQRTVPHEAGVRQKTIFARCSIRRFAGAVLHTNHAAFPVRSSPERILGRPAVKGSASDPAVKTDSERMREDQWI